MQLAVPDGVEAVPVDLWDEGLARVPTTSKVEMALALEAMARGADPRIRQVDSADYGDVTAEAALVSTTGIRSSTRKTSGYLSVSVIAATAMPVRPVGATAWAGASMGSSPSGRARTP